MTEDVNGDEDENDNENENDDSTSSPTSAPTSSPTIADENDTTTTTTVATVSGSFTLSTASGNKDTLCQASNLAVGGKTYEIVLEAFNKSGVSVKDIVTLTLFCPETTLLRERRLQEESFEISFEVTFAETSSAETFSTELTEAATDVGSYFESLVSETFNFTVSATVMVTTDDDNDDESSGVVGKVAFVGASCVLSVMGFLM